MWFTQRSSLSSTESGRRAGTSSIGSCRKTGSPSVRLGKRAGSSSATSALLIIFAPGDDLQVVVSLGRLGDRAVRIDGGGQLVLTLLEPDVAEADLALLAGLQAAHRFLANVVTVRRELHGEAPGLGRPHVL